MAIKQEFLLFILMLSLGFSCKHEKPVENEAPAWYKNLLIYNLDVKTFKNSDGDGMGDFNGLTGKLDYLKSMGVDMIWLAPFQPSPLQDDGYDVTDYYGIDKRVGTVQDFKTFIAAAQKRKIHVIMDMIMNHTSTQHPWFRAALKDTSSYHNWYIWSKERPKDWDEGMGFPVREKETWTYQPQAGAYYFHRFYTFEPDLNFQNPVVLAQAERVMQYWLKQGIDGFRLDAVPFIIDNPRPSSDKSPQDFSLLHQLVASVKKQNPHAILLGEANVEPKEDKKYFATRGSGLDMMFNFYSNQYLFYGFADGDIGLFKKALNDTRDKPSTAQWAYFLRNHDEIDLGRLSKGKLHEVYEKFGTDTNMQLYKRGIRRRLATMFGNDQQRLKMAYSLLFSLPGTPVIRYGEELGMGDDLKLQERLAIRTPMQWDSTRNGGFSKAAYVFRPVINQGAYGYQTVNVDKESHDPNSLLSFIKSMVKLRKQNPVIGQGNWRIIDGGSDHILAMQYRDRDNELLIIHNLSKEPQEFSFKKDLLAGSQITELISGKTEPVNDHKISLQGYGFKWYRLKP